MDVRRLARGITVCSCVMLATAPLTARADDTRLILLMNWLDEFRHTVAGNR